MGELDNKVYLITGAGSSISREIIIRFAKEDASDILRITFGKDFMPKFTRDTE